MKNTSSKQTDKNHLNSYLVKKGGAVHGRLFGDWWAAAKGFGDHSVVVSHSQSSLVHVHLLFQQSTWSTRHSPETRRGPVLTLSVGPLAPEPGGLAWFWLRTCSQPWLRSSALPPSGHIIPQGSAVLSPGTIPPSSIPFSEGTSLIICLQQLPCPTHGHGSPFAGPFQLQGLFQLLGIQHSAKRMVCPHGLQSGESSCSVHVSSVLSHSCEASERTSPAHPAFSALAAPALHLA